MFFQCFQCEFGEGDINYFYYFIMHVLAAAGFYSFMSFTLNLKNEIAKIPQSSRSIYNKYRIYKEISEN